MIERLFKHLQPFILHVVHRPLPVLLTSLILAIGGFLLATNLRIDNDLSKLIPEDYPSVQALNTLREQIGGEHEAAVAIHSPSFEANKRFGEDLIEPALQLTGKNHADPYFSRTEFRRNIDFVENNALYFATSQELDLLEESLKIQIEEAKKEANPFYFELEEDETPAANSLAEELDRQYDELIGSEYLISADSTILVIKLFPSGAQTDLEFTRDAYADLNRLINHLDPSSYHPDMEVVAAGRMLRTLIEVESITRDVISSFGAGVLMLMLVVILYFFYKSYRIRVGNYFSLPQVARQLIQVPAHTFIMGLPLVFSLCWTFGIAYLMYGNLNIMTSTLGLLLFGMGIDFGIHFFARYTEERGEGSSVEESILTTFMTTGQGIFAVGSTTAAAFFILMLADFKGFSEFGFIAGLGLLFAIMAYIMFLPALLVLLERSPLLNLARSIPKKTEPADHSPHRDPKHRLRLKVLSVATIAIAIIVTFLSLTKLPGLEFEYDFAKLEPTYVEYQQLNSLAAKVYSDHRTRNAAYIIVDHPSEALQVAEILRIQAETDDESPTIRDVEVFQDRYPVTPVAAEQKLKRIAVIRELLDDPFLKGTDNRDLQRLQLATSTRSVIPLDSVPDFIKAPFTSTSGAIGNLVIIHPSVGLSDGLNSMNFADDVGEVTLPGGKTYYAGSTSIVASDMLRLMMAEAPLMLILTITFIIVFKLFILQGVKWMLLALLPLVASFLWLFGLMETVGWKLNFYNLVVLPTILGIGDDSGIHIVHRYQEEGKGSIMRVLFSTGEHVTISILTTLLGFSGLLFSNHPGMRSIGEVAILGIGLSLFAAIFLLSSLLKLLERRDDERELRLKKKKMLQP